MAGNLTKKQIREILEKHQGPWDTVTFLFYDGFGELASLIVEKDYETNGLWRVDYRGNGRWDPPIYFQSIDKVVEHLYKNRVFLRR